MGKEEIHSWYLRFLWFWLSNRTLEFGPDSSGGTRYGSLLGIRASPCILAPWYFLFWVLFPYFHPVCASPASFELSADSRSVSSCKQLNIISGFPASFPAPHSFPGGGGGWWCCGAPILTREVQHFKARDSSQGGPPTRGR